MAYFQFDAFWADTQQPVQVEIYLGGKSRGYTPTGRGQTLDVETSQSGKFFWYAKFRGKKVREGNSNGGRIRIALSPT